MSRRRYRRYKRYRRDSVGTAFAKRTAKTFAAMLVLTAFVLSIAFSVKQLSSFDVDRLSDISGKYLARLGIGEEAAGEVAGEFMRRVVDVGIEDDSAEVLEGGLDEESEKQTDDVRDDKDSDNDVVFSLAIFADSHIANDVEGYIENKTLFKNSVEKAVELEVDRAVHLGDITNWGVISDLREAKEVLNESELKYYVIPGDHDLAQSVGTGNFIKVFGEDFHKFSIDDTKFVLLNNSANYTTIPDDAMAKFEKELVDADFVFLSQPIYSDGLGAIHSLIYMGSSYEDIEDEELAKKRGEVKEQRDTLLDLIRLSNVRAVIAADHHKSSELQDGTDASLTHYVVGPISGVGVSEYLKETAPQISVLRVYKNGKFEIESIIL